jgi:hypothetical protein
MFKVEEPSKCVYHMRFATPAACNLSDAKALRLELAADQDTAEL